MALQVHRFRLAVPSVADLAKRVVGGGTLVAGDDPSTPVFVDYKIDDADANSLVELTAELARVGFSYSSLNPGTTPTAAAATALGVGGASRVILLRDHFISSNDDTDEIGSEGWRVSLGGTGPDVKNIAGEITGGIAYHGILRIEGGTTAAARGTIHKGQASRAHNMLLNATQPTLDLNVRARPATTINVLDLERYVIGWGDNWGDDAEPANGIYVRYAPVTDLVGGYTLVTANGGTRSTSTSGTLPVLTTWRDFDIRLTYPGGVPTARLYIQGVAVGSDITTNFPAAAVSPGAGVFSVGATEPSLDLDYYEILQDAA